MVEYFIFDISRTIIMIFATIIFMKVYFRRRDLVLWLYGYFSVSISQLFRLFILEENDFYEIISLSFSALSLIFIIIAVSKEYFQTFSKKAVIQEIPSVIIIFVMTVDQIFAIGLNLIIAILLLIALFLLIKIYIIKKTPTHAFLILVLFCGLLNLITYTLKDGGLEGAEEFYQTSSTIMTTVLLVTGLVAFIEDRIVKSEQKYRRAFNRAEFYKDLFVHDINNILQNLQFSLEIISQDLSKEFVKENIDEMINIAKNQVIRGSNLGLNVKRLSDLEGGSVQLVEIKIKNLVKKAIEYINTSFPTENINITMDSDNGDLIGIANELLGDVFRIILNNSINYNENLNKEILIKISKELRNENSYIKLEFIDNGIGIPDVVKQSFFQPIYKNIRKQKRIGLGLILVNEVVKSLKGEIRVEDKVEGDYTKGTIIILSIPEASDFLNKKG